MNNIKMYTEKAKIALAFYGGGLENVRPQVGLGNAKTSCVNEKTLAGSVGTCGNGCAHCQGFCYAIKMYNLYPNVLKAGARNTLLRRQDPVGYYSAFFARAIAEGLPLRLNEGGDFESMEDLNALETCLERFGQVKVIAYTHNVGLLRKVGELMHEYKNFKCHFSLEDTLDPEAERLARKYNVPCTSVDDSKTTCLNQMAKANGKKWSCKMCCEKNCGCFSNKDVVFKKH